MGAFAEAVGNVVPVDEESARAARAHHDRLTKPRGSLGRLEDVGVQLAAIAAASPPPVPEPATVAVFAADHGVLAEGVSPWPAEVTAQMVANFCAGGAAINVLARQVGAKVTVVDVGVASELEPADGLVLAKVRAGTADIAVEPAMTRGEALAALDVGAEVAAGAVSDGARCLVTGDMGIANTTPSAALIAAVTGNPAEAVTGRGTGIGDDMLATKVAVVERALARAGAPGSGVGTSAGGALSGPRAGSVTGPAGGGTGAPERTVDPVELLSSLGGLEISALAGFVVGGASARVPVVVDGVIALAATLVASLLAPAVLGYCVAGHRSTEPGATVAMEHLGLSPLLDLGMRLGEGSGACLALPALQSAARVLSEMATFDSAGVTDKGT